MLKQSDFYIFIREKELMWAFWIQRRQATGVVIGIVLKAGDTGDVGLIPESERSPGGGNSNPLQYSYLGNPMDRGAWWATPTGSQRVRHDRTHKHMHFGLSLTLPLPSFQGFGN